MIKNSMLGKCVICEERHKLKSVKGTWICHMCSNYNKMQKHLDTVFSRFIRMRDGKCMYNKCKNGDNEQCSHVIGKRWQYGRWLAINAVDLCAFDHLRRWHGEESTQMRMWFQETYPERWEEIRLEFQIIRPKMTLADLQMKMAEIIGWIKTLQEGLSSMKDNYGVGIEL